MSRVERFQPLIYRMPFIIAEHRDGRLELLDWAAKARREAAADAPALEPAA